MILTEEQLHGRGRSGIRNIGNSCYASAALQMLSHCPSFLRFVMTTHEVDGGDGKPKELLRALFKVYHDNWVSGICADPCPVFAALVAAGNSSPIKQTDWQRQNDAHEFLVKLLELLQTECGVKVKVNQGTNVKQRVLTAERQLAHDWAAAHPARSALAELMHGQLACDSVCGDCDAKQTASDVFLALRIEVTKSVVDSVARVFRKEYIVDSGWVCEACKGTPRRVARRCRLWRAPQVLLLQVNRFDARAGLSKDSSTLHIALNMDLSRVFNGTSELRPYRLMAVMCHTGAANFGHYFCYCRDAWTNEWFCFDDENVVRVNDFASIPTRHAYLLAYEQFSIKGG